jgi:hypothetical protein
MEALTGRCNEVLRKGEVARAWEGKLQGLQVIENEQSLRTKSKKILVPDNEVAGAKGRAMYQVDIPTFSLRVSIVIIDQGKAAIKSEPGRCEAGACATPCTLPDGPLN